MEAEALKSCVQGVLLVQVHGALRCMLVPRDMAGRTEHIPQTRSRMYSRYDSEILVLCMVCCWRRCKVLHGDCTRVAPRGVADRVMLGLLPSSEDSWPAAVAALKPSGESG